MTKLDQDALLIKITKTQLVCTVATYIRYFAKTCGRFDQQVVGNMLVIKPNVRGSYEFSPKSHKSMGSYYATASKLVAQLDPSKLPLEIPFHKGQGRDGLVVCLGDAVLQQQLLLRGTPFIHKFIKQLRTLTQR
jgi:hypothetical protein